MNVLKPHPFVFVATSRSTHAGIQPKWKHRVNWQCCTWRKLDFVTQNVEWKPHRKLPRVFILKKLKNKLFGLRVYRSVIVNINTTSSQYDVWWVHWRENWKLIAKLKSDNYGQFISGDNESYSICTRLLQCINSIDYEKFLLHERRKWFISISSWQWSDRFRLLCCRRRRQIS